MNIYNIYSTICSTIYDFQEFSGLNDYFNLLSFRLGPSSLHQNIIYILTRNFSFRAVLSVVVFVVSV